MWKQLLAAFNKKKAVVGAFSVIVKLQTSRKFISSSGSVSVVGSLLCLVSKEETKLRVWKLGLIIQQSVSPEGTGQYLYLQQQWPEHNKTHAVVTWNIFKTFMVWPLFYPSKVDVIKHHTQEGSAGYLLPWWQSWTLCPAAWGRRCSPGEPWITRL